MFRYSLVFRKWELKDVKDNVLNSRLRALEEEDDDDDDGSHGRKHVPSLYMFSHPSSPASLFSCLQHSSGAQLHIQGACDEPPTFPHQETLTLCPGKNGPLQHTASF